MKPITRKQREALFAVFRRDHQNYETPFKAYVGYRCPHCRKYPGEMRIASRPYRTFRRTVQPYFDKSGCIMVPWQGMWLGIETDGYTHS